MCVYGNKHSDTGNRTSGLLLSEAKFYFWPKVQQSEASLDRYSDLQALQCVLHHLSAETFSLLFGSSAEFTPAVHHFRKSIIQHILVFLFPDLL